MNYRIHIIHGHQHGPGTPAHKQFPNMCWFYNLMELLIVCRKKYLNYLMYYLHYLIQVPSPLREQSVTQVTEDRVAEPSQVTAENPLATWKYLRSLLTQRRTSPSALTPGDLRLAGFTRFCTLYWIHKHHFVLQAPSPAAHVGLYAAIITYRPWIQDRAQHRIPTDMFLLNTDEEGPAARSGLKVLLIQMGWKLSVTEGVPALHTNSPANSKLLSSMNWISKCLLSHCQTQTTSEEEIH